LQKLTMSVTPGIRRYGKADADSVGRKTPGSAVMNRRKQILSTPLSSARKEATPNRFHLSKTDPAAAAVRNILFEEEEDEDDANTSWSSVDSQPVHEIVNELESDFKDTITEAADKLQLMAIEANEGQRNELAASGAPAKLVQLVQDGAPVDEVIGALQNFAASSKVDDDVKAELVRAGVIPTLLEVLRKEEEAVPPTVKMSAIAVMLNLAIGCEARKTLITQCGAIPLIAPLVLAKYTEAHVDLLGSAMRALTSLSIGSEARKVEISARLDMGGLMESMSTDVAPELWQPALALIQSLVFCNDNRKKEVLDLGFIEKATLLLASGQLTPEVEEMVTKLLVGFATFQGIMAQESSSTAAVVANGEVGMVGGAIAAIGSAFSWLIVGDEP